MSEYTYTIYVRAAPADLWRALTDPELTSRYWSGLRFSTDWRAGSSITWCLPEVEIVDVDQVVVVADAPRRLAFTWQTFTDAWAAAHGVPPDVAAAFAAEPRSTATFELEPGGDATRLTLRHGDFDPGSAVAAAVAEGWPAILSSLKSLLETGSELGFEEG
ncbi:MAG: SRPBCC family protein [Acidimicrobiales bacterium]